MSADGLSFAKIAKCLNDEAIPTMRDNGRKWAQSTIGQILKNRSYLGELSYKTGEEAFIQKNAHEAIITEQQFMAAQKKNVLSTERKLHGSPSLVGKVVCGECGRSMPRSTHMCNGQEVVTYQCQTGTVVSNTTCYQGTISESEISEQISLNSKSISNS